MALSTPTTQEVADAIIASIEGELGKTFTLLPKSFTRVLAKALSGVFVLAYRYAGWTYLQMFVAHASWRETTVNGVTLRPLVEWGRLVGVGDPVAATNAVVFILFNVPNPDSSTLPAGTQLVHPSSGVIYITQTAVTLDAGLKTVEALAASDPDGNGGSGTIGNRVVGDVLKWANPLPQLSVEGATVVNTTTSGIDAESEAAYRQRVVDAFAAPPQGGAYADYAIWATSVPGIINAYPYTGRYPGIVNVFIEASEATAANEDGQPTGDQLEQALEACQFDQGGGPSRRPIGALVNVSSISRQAFDVSVQGLAASDTALAQQSIEEALDDYLRSRGPYIQGLTRLPRADRITESAVAGVVDEAASGVGATVNSVELNVLGSQLSAYTLNAGEKAKLGDVVFI